MTVATHDNETVMPVSLSPTLPRKRGRGANGSLREYLDIYRRFE